MGFNNNFSDNFKLYDNVLVGLEIEFFSDNSYIKLLELLNVYFAQIDKKVWGFNSYHSDFIPTDKEFKIEPDYSGGPDMIELITGPMQYVESRMVLIMMMNFIKMYGYTDNSSSVHLNISFINNDNKIENLNPLKLILSLNEDVVYNIFPNRRNNIYCQSIKWVIPFTDYPDSETGVNMLSNGLLLPDDTKYYGVNLSKKYKGWLEWRYIGGIDYHLKTDDILYLLDYFISITLKSFEIINEEDNIKLLSYLDDNIAWYTQYDTYDNFLANIDGVRVLYDGISDIESLRVYWGGIKDRLFNIIKMAKSGSIKDGLFNFNSEKNKFEIVNANIQNMYTVKNIDFVNCKIDSITCYDCEFADSTIANSHIWNSEIFGSNLNKCKLTNCIVTEFSELNECVFDGKEIINSIMKGGVFRDGKIGEDTQIDKSVRMSNKESFWSIYDPNNKKISPIKKLEI